MAELDLLVDGLSARIGGGMTVLRGLGGALASRDDARVRFLVRGQEAKLLAESIPSGSLIPIHFQSEAQRLWWEQTRLLAYARDHGQSALLGLSNVAPFFGRPTSVRRGVLLQNVAPLLPEIRGQFGGRSRMRLEALRALTTRSCRASDIVFAFSRYAEELASTVSRGTPTCWIPPGDSQGTQSSWAPNWEEPYGLLVGDLYRYKGVEDVVGAILRMDDSDFRVVVCGASVDPTYLESLRRTISEQGVERRIRFVGPVPRATVLQLMVRAICFIQTSRVESLCLPLGEALGIGVPIISTRIPVAAEVCGGSASYYDPGDVLALAGLLTKAREGRVDGPTRKARRSWSEAAQGVVEGLSDGHRV